MSQREFQQFSSPYLHPRDHISRQARSAESVALVTPRNSARKTNVLSVPMTTILFGWMFSQLPASNN